LFFVASFRIWRPVRLAETPPIAASRCLRPLAAPSAATSAATASPFWRPAPWTTTANVASGCARAAASRPDCTNAELGRFADQLLVVPAKPAARMTRLATSNRTSGRRRDRAEPPPRPSDQVALERDSRWL